MTAIFTTSKDAAAGAPGPSRIGAESTCAARARLGPPPRGIGRLVRRVEAIVVIRSLVRPPHVAAGAGGASSSSSTWGSRAGVGGGRRRGIATPRDGAVVVVVIVAAVCPGPTPPATTPTPFPTFATIRPRSRSSHRRATPFRLPRPTLLAQLPREQVLTLGRRDPDAVQQPLPLAAEDLPDLFEVVVRVPALVRVARARREDPVRRVDQRFQERVADVAQLEMANLAIHVLAVEFVRQAKRRWALRGQ